MTKKLSVGDYIAWHPSEVPHPKTAIEHNLNPNTLYKVKEVHLGKYGDSFRIDSKTNKNQSWSFDYLPELKIYPFGMDEPYGVNLFDFY